MSMSRSRIVQQQRYIIIPCTLQMSRSRIVSQYIYILIPCAGRGIGLVTHQIYTNCSFTLYELCFYIIRIVVLHYKNCNFTLNEFQFYTIRIVLLHCKNCSFRIYSNCITLQNHTNCSFTINTKIRIDCTNLYNQLVLIVRIKTF